jgi:hypothetical protein
MKLLKSVTTICCVTFIGSLLPTAAKADDWDHKTMITFGAPVEIPGVHLAGWGILPAGTYVFKLLDSESDRHIVQIFNKDETTVYATILAIPDYRLKPTDKTVITFRERPAGAPEALRAWFSPGSNSGEEFVYPKAKATELAKDTNTPVLFTSADIAVEVTEPFKSTDEPVLAALKQAPVLAVKPTGEEMQLSEVVTSLPAPPAQLPSTASYSPLIGLLGFIALSAALTLRLAGKRP